MRNDLSQKMYSIAGILQKQLGDYTTVSKKDMLNDKTMT